MDDYRTAFNTADVVSTATYWTPAQPFGQSVRSTYGASTTTFRRFRYRNIIFFNLHRFPRQRWIDFLLGGGKDPNKNTSNSMSNLYVALVRASDNAELMKVSGFEKKGYTRMLHGRLQISWRAGLHQGCRQLHSRIRTCQRRRLPCVQYGQRYYETACVSTRVCSSISRQTRNG